MKQNCIIVDDEQTARKILKTYIADVSTLCLKGEFKNAIDALEFIHNNAIDLIFLDIEMPKLSGINFAKIINKNTQIIFTTAHREFALEGFELNAVDYLLKPFSFDRFLMATQKTNTALQNKIELDHKDYAYLKVNKEMIKINFSELLYIEGLSNYIKVHTLQDTFVVYEKLSVLTKSLPSELFMRIHKSYIVNTSKITRYTREYVEINRNHIPISSTYKTDLLTYLKS